MSKRKKLLLNCPTCGSSLFIKKSLFRISHHPIYIKKGNLIINYSRNVYTEKKETKFWLKCINCAFSRDIKNESDLKAEISFLILEKAAVSKPLKFKTEKPKSLPMIQKPPKAHGVEYDLETNTFSVNGVNHVYD